MPYTSVDETQFQFVGDGFRHKPTGAFFAFDPGQTWPKRVDWANAGRVLEDGHYFDLAEIQLIAEVLIAQHNAAIS
jgi:hypothetical protein